jgi:2-oxo-4-hydroxy-4-carboxy--5-ureidoimidazoline (OHCU) decarboxylase
MSAWEPDEAPAADFTALLAPLFEAAPRFIDRLAAGRPYGSWSALFERAEAVALAMPADEQLELIDAHPRIGAPPGSVSTLSFVEQGYGQERAQASAEAERLRVQGDLERLNAAYEARFGFRFVVFVAGRPRSAIVPLMARALDADRAREMERALRDVVAIARDRARRTGLLDEPAGSEATSGRASLTSGG